MSYLCLSAKISELGPTPSYPNILNQSRGTFSFKKCAKTKKSNCDKKKSQKFFVTSFFYHKAFGPDKQPNNRQNTTLLMLTLKATLENVRENKIDSTYIFLCI